MALRHIIHEQIRLRNLNSPWTTSDLLNNKTLTKRFKKSTLRTEPPNCSRGAAGLGLGDGENADDYFYYMRVGNRDGARLYELCPAESIDYSVLLQGAPKSPTVINNRTLLNPLLNEILDHLYVHAKPMVNDVKEGFANGTLTNEDAWYQASYTVLAQRGEPKSLAAFICLIAYAYSWLPINRVAACPTQRQFASLKAAIRECRRSNTMKNRVNLVWAAQAAIGVSRSAVVTVSKVLHFWDSTLVPMYDINVRRALQQLRGAPHPDWDDATDWDDAKKAVANYLAYWSLADDLIAASENHRIGS